MDSKHDKDMRSRQYPMLLAGGIVAAVALWMLSGVGSEPDASSVTQAEGSHTAAELQQVRVQTMTAQDIVRVIVISGRTEPNRAVQLKAEIEGSVTAIRAERGDILGDDAAVLTLDMRDRNARLGEAKALVEQREIELRAIENLRDREFSTDIQIAEARSALEGARASRERIELEIRNTTIVAPFAGVLQERSVEIGDFVRAGDVVAEVVDLDPLVIAAEVNEREVAALALGSEGRAVLVDGTELVGRVRYLSPVADAGTRSFAIELAVPNPDSAVRAGLSAQLRLAGNSVRVHTLSAALLSLADDGTVGVKVVDGNNTVRFHPATIAGTVPEGLQVTGLPDSVQVITVGQGFVTEGQRVQPVTLPAGVVNERAD